MIEDFNTWYITQGIRLDKDTPEFYEHTLEVWRRIGLSGREPNDALMMEELVFRPMREFGQKMGEFLQALARSFDSAAEALERYKRAVEDSGIHSFEPAE